MKSAGRKSRSSIARSTATKRPEASGKARYELRATRRTVRRVEPETSEDEETDELDSSSACRPSPAPESKHSPASDASLELGMAEDHAIDLETDRADAESVYGGYVDAGLGVLLGGIAKRKGLPVTEDDLQQLRESMLERVVDQMLSTEEILKRKHLEEQGEQERMLVPREYVRSAAEQLRSPDSKVLNRDCHVMFTDSFSLTSTFGDLSCRFDCGRSAYHR